MDNALLESWTRTKGLSRQDALQAFLQVIALKNISLAEARFIGGTALVWAYGNPRFSEDLDFAGVMRPMALQKDMEHCARELQGWLGVPVRIRVPREKRSTWKLICALSRSESARLHIDTQPYATFTHSPALIRFPGIPPFVAASVEVEEIMADKIIALAQRRYLSGRDLFDLWFHWFKTDGRQQRDDRIKSLLDKKAVQRAVSLPDLASTLKDRLGSSLDLRRARLEWKRYLPAAFQGGSVERDILFHTKRIFEIMQ